MSLTNKSGGFDEGLVNALIKDYYKRSLLLLLFYNFFIRFFIKLNDKVLDDS